MDQQKRQNASVGKSASVGKTKRNVLAAKIVIANTRMRSKKSLLTSISQVRHTGFLQPPSF